MALKLGLMNHTKLEVGNELLKEIELDDWYFLPL